MKSASFLPGIPLNSPTKEYLPIRSITYRKKIDTIKDLRMNRPVKPSLSEVPYLVLPRKTTFLPSLFYLASQQIPQLKEIEKSTTQGTKTERSLGQSHIALDFQKLKFYRSPKCITDRSLDSRKSRNALKRIKGYGISNQVTSKSHLRPLKSDHDYFELLMDKDRKRFNVNEFEGVDDYDQSTIMNRIYSQGFRSPDYYSKSLRFEYLEAPDEKTIKEEHTLKIEPWISELENPNAEVAHVLGGTSNEITYTWNVMKGAKDTMDALKTQKKELRKEMEVLKREFEAEISTILQEYNRVFGNLKKIIHENEVNNLTDKFKMQKEIVLLQREKQRIEKEISKGLEKVNTSEKKMYGRKIFELQAVHQFLEDISDNNLRFNRSKLMKNKRIIH